MAKVDIINIRGNKERCVNLSNTVGAGGRNEKSDVMAIQALFYYLYFDKEAKLTGLPLLSPALAVADKFSPTGLLDILTIQTIAFFQTTHRQHLLSADAIIHPANYEGRVIKDTNKPLMTITYLHLLAKRRELRSGDGDYIKKIKGIIGLFHSVEIAASMLPKNLK